ncbi:hypothetical protein FCL47_12970 [Desulfopila sp. IMCC35006]|uniref:hypothetical protein n=1 Tax=Desulfopila sp. IMCC35006 TaxID=2569542 RepID=UPI0010ADA177|nr:hypothetical protein [Desulfopila sp. IMCC35006]TKB25991.1 hypothetical protein FCL47_12970 [Desulfopila sp. IMCC35006]
MIPTFAYAGETKILFYQSKLKGIPGLVGDQTSKDYYIKESLKKIDNNPNLLQIKIYATTTSPEGTTTYRYTEQINCTTRKFTMIQYWSSGYGNDNGTMVDGEWKPVDDYDGFPQLMEKICKEK